MLNAIVEKILIAFYFLRQRYWIKFRSRAQLERWQQRRLRHHLAFLRRHSQFYSHRLREPWTATTPIDKKIMMENFDQLNTRGLRREDALTLALNSENNRDFSPMIADITVGLSSGTSGHRGLFCADFKERAAYAGTILAKALPRGRWHERHRVAFFLRANSNLYKTVQSRSLEFHYFDLLHPLSDHLDRLRMIQPTLLIGPPSLLVQLADQVDASKLQPHSIRRIYSVAEVLDPVDERRITKAFAQKVHQIYQCTEGFLAISCEHGSLHLNEDLLIVEKEWIDENSGRFMPILTDLNRRTQPVLRYRLNDILTEDRVPCPCGSVMTRLKMIEGRCDDMLEFPQGQATRAVFPDFLRNAILFASPEISEYRVTQLASGAITVALRGSGPMADLERRVREELERLAHRLDCELPPVDFVHEFPELNGRKLRRIIRQNAVAHLP